MCATGLDNSLSIGAGRGLISSHIPTPAPLGSNHLENLKLMEWEWTAWTEPHTWKQLHLASYRCRKTGDVHSQQCFQGTVRWPHLLRLILDYQSTLPAAICSAKQAFLWHKHVKVVTGWVFFGILLPCEHCGMPHSWCLRCGRGSVVKHHGPTVELSGLRQ